VAPTIPQVKSEKGVNKVCKSKKKMTVEQKDKNQETLLKYETLQHLSLKTTFVLTTNLAFCQHKLG
jgi:hypothetical protein